MHGLQGGKTQSLLAADVRQIGPLTRTIDNIHLLFRNPSQTRQVTAQAVSGFSASNSCGSSNKPELLWTAPESMHHPAQQHGQFRSLRADIRVCLIKDDPA
ncbi:hypothetical protein D3C81_683730 [compost metagenome]